MLRDAKQILNSPSTDERDLNFRLTDAKSNGNYCHFVAEWSLNIPLAVGF